MNLPCVVSVIAPVNIAVIKYWGKRDEELILPLNDSVSGTLDLEIMHARTSVCASPSITSNRIWLNGKEENFQTDRILNCLNALKQRAAQENSVEKEVLSWNLNVRSENNFPTAAGLASSAAGYACFVSAIAKLYKIKSDISTIARMGSGSACRSVYGGFVQWHAGKNNDGSDSYATQIVGADHWPEMRVLILVVNDKEKKVSSTKGMNISVNTSDLLKYRVSKCVPIRTECIIKAIQEKDFKTFAEITMKDSNQFHAVCLDTFPPCIYMNDISHKIADIIHKYNEIAGEIRIAYTFDAGPNACLYLLESETQRALSVLKHLFPSDNKDFMTGLVPPDDISIENVVSLMKEEPQPKNMIKYIIYTRIGGGPTEVEPDFDLFRNEMDSLL